MRWLVRGDLDGFFGLALDNLFQFLLIETLCRSVLGFPGALTHRTVLPAAAVSLLVGNLYYARQALQLALEQGFILTSMLISATVVFIIRRRFVTAAAWCGVAALLAAGGLIHSYKWLAGRHSSFLDSSLALGGGVRHHGSEPAGRPISHPPSGR